MNCPFCNNDLPDDSEFCQYCGKNLIQETTKADEYVISEQVKPFSQNNEITKPELSEKYEKQLFCRRCGNKLDLLTKKCTGCNRQYFRFSRKIAIWVLAGLIIVGLLGANVYQYFINVERQNNIANLEIELNADGSMIAQQSSAIQQKDTTIKKNNDSISALEEDLSFYEENEDFIFDSIERAAFLMDSIAIVPDDNTYRFHRYGCEYCDMTYYWAYNTELAIAKGYKACPHCCSD